VKGEGTNPSGYAPGPAIFNAGKLKYLSSKLIFAHKLLCSFHYYDNNDDDDDNSKVCAINDQQNLYTNDI